MKKILCFIAVLLTIFIISCGTGQQAAPSNTVDAVTSASEARFSKLEIREYKGTKLDPSVGPRDNSISGIQTVDISSYVLKVSGLVKQPVSLAYEEVTSLDAYEKLITLYCVEGWEATVLWKGALLKDIIDLAGAETSANSVVFHCVDGYTTLLPLQDIIDKNMILAYTSNNIALPPSLGYPFIVVAEDKLGYKWARWVNEIELTDDPDYLGYWESRGFDNEADVTASDGG